MANAARTMIEEREPFCQHLRQVRDGELPFVTVEDAYGQHQTDETLAMIVAGLRREFDQHLVSAEAAWPVPPRTRRFIDQAIAFVRAGDELEPVSSSAVEQLAHGLFCASWLAGLIMSWLTDAVWPRAITGGIATVAMAVVFLAPIIRMVGAWRDGRHCLARHLWLQRVAPMVLVLSWLLALAAMVLWGLPALSRFGSPTPDGDDTRLAIILLGAIVILVGSVLTAHLAYRWWTKPRPIEDDHWPFASSTDRDTALGSRPNEPPPASAVAMDAPAGSGQGETTATRHQRSCLGRSRGLHD